MTEDLRALKAAINKHLENPAARPLDTEMFVAKVQEHLKDRATSDWDKIELAALGWELAALQRR